MAGRQLIGVDVGTTGVKAVLIDEVGSVLADLTVAHDLHSPHTGWAEEDPEDWIVGTISTLQGIATDSAFEPEHLAGVGVSGMVPALVLLDAQGKPLRPSIQQNDARAHVEVLEISSEIDQASLFSRTGGRTNLQHIAPRLRWVQRHEPEIWRKTRTILGSYDYVTACLTGEHPASCSLELNWAIESGLFSLSEQDWADDLLSSVNLSRDYLPPVRQPVDIVGALSSQVSAQTGLPAGVPVIAGSADHIASALASGLRENGDTLIKFGGAGDILYCSDSLVTHPDLFIDAHDIPGKYLLNGCMAASGSLVKWYVGDILGRPVMKATLQELDAQAEQVPAGSDGVVVLPYFLGEKTPILDPLARGVIFGLDLSHGPQHIFRAVLESVIFGFRHHVDVLNEAGRHPTRFLATNGGVGSGIWRQIAADVLGEPVTSFRHHPGSCLGVAFVAGMATGVFSEWDDIDRFLLAAVVNRPDPANKIVYERQYKTYRQLYVRLQSLFQTSW
ncbi:FGGY-family carbohydrate kinase [soil metagenome]